MSVLPWFEPEAPGKRFCEARVVGHSVSHCRHPDCRKEAVVPCSKDSCDYMWCNGHSDHDHALCASGDCQELATHQIYDGKWKYICPAHERYFRRVMKERESVKLCPECKIRPSRPSGYCYSCYGKFHEYRRQGIMTPLGR